MAFTTPPIRVPDITPVVQSHVLLENYHTDTGEPRIITFATNRRDGVVICEDDIQRVVCGIMEFEDELHALLDIDGPTRYDERMHVLWSCLIRDMDFTLPGDELRLLQAACAMLAAYHEVRASGYGFMARQADANAGIVERRFPDYEGNVGLWEFQGRLETVALRDADLASKFRDLSQCEKLTEMIELRMSLKFPER